MTPYTIIAATISAKKMVARATRGAIALPSHRLVLRASAPVAISVEVRDGIAPGAIG